MKATVQTVYDDSPDLFIGTVDVVQTEQQVSQQETQVKLMKQDFIDSHTNDNNDNSDDVCTMIVHSETENDVCIMNDDNICTLQYDTDVTPTDRWTEPLEVNGSIIPLKLDTGAKVNIVSYDDWKSLKNHSKIIDRNVQLRAYDGTPIPSLGMSRLTVRVRGRLYQCLFVIVPQGQSLLCDRDCERLGLVQKLDVNSVNTENDKLTEFISKYSQVFKCNTEEFNAFHLPYHNAR